ncbi:MAG TPA: hypothetical protein ENK66_01405 [Arcobacter sp.]|nr:hypothetical protein [Arcobacter sp.]
MGIKKIILHIGSEKTGTSTIQEWFVKQRSSLLQHGILYPKSPGYMSHVKLAIYASNEPFNKELHQLYFPKEKKFSDVDFENELHRELENTSAETVIFSNEHLSSCVRTQAGINKLIKLLKYFTSEIQLIFYIRRQDNFWLSHYSTEVIVGSPNSLQIPKDKDIFLYDYYSIVELWRKALDRNNIIVCRFGKKLQRTINLKYENETFISFVKRKLKTLSFVSKLKSLRVN